MENRIGHILRTSGAVIILLCFSLLFLTQCFIPEGTTDLRLTVGDDGNGATEPSGEVTVTIDGATDISATADPAYIFSSWTVESGTGVVIGDGTSAVTTVTLTSGDAAIKAAFTLIPKLYVANYDVGTVSVIDGLDGTVIATVGVDSWPFSVGTNPETGKVYIVHYDAVTEVIDGSTDTVIGTIAYGWGEDSGVAVDPSTNTIFASAQWDGDILVIDGNTDTLTGTFVVDFSGYGGTYPTGMAVNPVTGKLYISDWASDDIHIYSAAPPYASIASVPVDLLDWAGIAVNAVTNRVYAASDSTDTLYVIDGSTDSELTTVTVGGEPIGVAVNSVTNTIYVTNNLDDTVSVVDGATHTVIATIPVGVAPIGVAVSENFNRIYVVNSTVGTISIIDGTTNTVIDTVAVGANPQFIGVLE